MIPCACVRRFECEVRLVRKVEGESGGVFETTGIRAMLDWLMKKAHFHDIDNHILSLLSIILNV